MRLTLAPLLLVATTNLAAALPQHKDPSAAQSLADLVAGAVTFPFQYLSGNEKGVKQSIGLMNDGAASFSPNFLKDLGKVGANVGKGSPH
jgi:hypothetical protein